MSAGPMSKILKIVYHQGSGEESVGLASLQWSAFRGVGDSCMKVRHGGCVTSAC